MTSYRGSVKALAIIIVLLSIIVVSKLDNKQIKTETSTYYETRLYTVTSAPPAETVTEVVPTVQTDLKGLNQYKSAFIAAGVSEEEFDYSQIQNLSDKKKELTVTFVISTHMRIAQNLIKEILSACQTKLVE